VSVLAARVVQLTDEELLAKRGDLAYAFQMCALEGLAVDESTREEAQACEDEIKRRGLRSE
jgi:hypothetical protein